MAAKMGYSAFRFFSDNLLSHTGRFLLYGFMILFAVMMFPDPAPGQASAEDVVYLKNGNILRGEIVELKQGEYLKIEISGRNRFVVMMDDVSEITSEAAHQPENHQTTGYMNRSGFEILSGRGNSARFYMVNGYRFNSRISAGIGLGLTLYNDPLTLVPLFIDFNFRFLEANASPFFSLKFGYNITTHYKDEVDLNMHRGGLLFNPGVGLQFNRNSGFGWYINAGFNIDNSYYEFDGWGTETVQNELSFRRVNFGMGLSF